MRTPLTALWRPIVGVVLALAVAGGMFVPGVSAPKFLAVTGILGSLVAVRTYEKRLKLKAAATP